MPPDLEFCKELGLEERSHLLPERFQAFQLYKLLEIYEIWESGRKVITFDGPAESLNYDSALAWMEQEIKPSPQIEYYDSYSYSRHVEGN